MSEQHVTQTRRGNKPDLLLLSTCGTSLFSNQASSVDRSWLNRVTNVRALSIDDERHFKQLYSACHSRLFESDDEAKRSLSAELNSIGATLTYWESPRVQHILVHSDTHIGEAAAKLLQQILEEMGHQVQLLTAPGLRTDDSLSLRHALSELSRSILDWIPADRHAGHHVIFNLTGGFKSVNAYLQAIGTLYADRCVFLFESSQQLMEIPRLPVRLNEQDEIRKNLTAFRKLHIGYSVSQEDLCGNVDSLLVSVYDEVTTTPWGEAAWAQARLPLLGDEILDPLSPRLKISAGLKKTFKDLQADRRLQVNEALDALSSHLDNGRPLLKSNTFKQLEGAPMPPSTHELYLWSDSGAWRLFGHYESSTFIADSIGPHL